MPKSHYNFPKAVDFQNLYENDFYVYINHRPNGDPFYVGKGKVEYGNLQRYHHAHKGNKYYNNIVRKYGEEKIITQILYCESEEKAFRYEIELIYMLRCCGSSLANKADGGQGGGGWNHTQEAKIAIAIAGTGRPRSAEAIEAHRQKFIGHPAWPAKTPEALNNQRTGRLGVKNTSEHNRKISESNKGEPCKPETAAKIKEKAIIRQHTRLNQTIIDTPWDQLGLWDACEKSGLKWKTFKGRYDKGFRGEKLFNIGRNPSIEKGRKVPRKNKIHQQKAA